LQFGVVERGQLLELGFTPARIHHLIETGHLTPIHRGVYAVGHTSISTQGQMLGAVLAVGGISAVSRRSAANHLGLWRFPFGESDVTLAGTGGRKLQGINIHRSRSFGPGHLFDYEGVPTTSVAWTLIDLAATIGKPALGHCFDVADRKDLIDYDELAYLLRKGSGRPGVATVRSLANLDRTQTRRTRSTLELDFLAFCRAKDIPEPLINYVLGGFEVDACWPDSGVVVELDSWEWHGNRESFERDRAKACDLEAAGLRVVAVTSRRLKRDRGTVAARLRALLDRGDATSLRTAKSTRITWSG
jgi:very-short-patch-repair endonuclease